MFRVRIIIIRLIPWIKSSNVVFFIIDGRRTGKDPGMRCRKDGLNEDRLRVGDYEIENWA